MTIARCLLLCFAAIAIVRVHSQSSGIASDFISIDCGIPAGSSYADPITNLTYVSDAQFIDAGVDKNISGAYVTSFMEQQARRYLNVRSFPDGVRSCYTIPVTPGVKYLLRATFLYGDYDGLGSASVMFDLYLGVNRWNTVNVSDPAAASRTEAIAVALEDHFSVCLVNTGRGTPFVSGIDLRPLKAIIYPAANATRSLVVFNRLNMGPTDTTIRYPDDKYDRIWEPFNNIPLWEEISTKATVENLAIDFFEAPTAVMQTAVTPVNSSNLTLSLSFDPNNELLGVMYFSEFLTLTGNMSRQFYLYLNDRLWYGEPYTAPLLRSDSIYDTKPISGYSSYITTLQALSNSTLPPILNAMEIFSVMSNVNVPADSGDVDAMKTIKAWYQIKGNWMGDPCSPKDMAWDGLKCAFSLSNPPRITTLNLSSRGLTGQITAAFARLTAIQYLDLSYNNLTGAIPAILAELPSLVLLDLTNNRLYGTIPSTLLTKAREGPLMLRIEGNPSLCENGSSCQVIQSSTKKKITAPVIAILCILPPLLLVLVIVIIWRRKKTKGKHMEHQPINQDFSHNVMKNQDMPMQFENRQFTYMELKYITNDFERVLGGGGFGTVYYGCLEDGTQVAVKMRSQSTLQGDREFLAEAQHLTRVHHKNLVSLVGYCKDGEYPGLVYEYMAQGSLQTHLQGIENTVVPLSWGQRLHIAVEAAQGLEYLHKGCEPPLIHRDVKSGNILLSERLEAKIADFGLSKAFQDTSKTHVSTAVKGTPGYVDPEYIFFVTNLARYHSTFQVSEKSDAYSFGVVLLELITGKPPIISGDKNQHISQWVHQRLARGNIEDVVDCRLHGEYDINSVWKCVNIALECTSRWSSKRPTMVEVVMQLKESLELENLRLKTQNRAT